MAVTRAPTRNTTLDEANKSKLDDSRVNEVIRRGGSVANDRREEAFEDEQRNVQLRLYQSMIAEIDECRSGIRRGKKPSRHSWIVTAIEEKLARER